MKHGNGGRIIHGLIFHSWQNENLIGSKHWKRECLVPVQSVETQNYGLMEQPIAVQNVDMNTGDL